MEADEPGRHGEEPSGEDAVAEAREAATLILLRDGEEGPEVLLVRRHPDQRFMGGAWVFPGGSTEPDDGDELRAAVRELEEEAGIELSDAHEVVRFSRWITPAEMAIRFDTHFFVAEAPEGSEPTVDGDECIDWCWIRPRAALEAQRAGEMELVFPTIKHLEQLARFRTVSEVLETARAMRVLPVEPRVLVEGGVARVVLPDEPDYDD